MKIHCNPLACPLILSSSCVFYEGPNLIYIGVTTNTSIEQALTEINEFAHHGGFTGSYYVNIHVGTSPPTDTTLLWMDTN